jgi:hypothetical protein
MYLQREQADALLQGSLTTIRERIQSHLAFVTELPEGDDWTFVIKTQALLEACVTEAVLVRLGDDRIKRTVETMSLIGEGATKLQFAKDLGLLEAPQRRFIKKLASLRNRLAHRVEYVNFKFPDHIASLDRDARKDWQDSVVWFGELPTSREQWRELALEQPRSAVLMSAFLVAAVLAVEDNQAKLMRAIDAASEKTTTELLKYLHGANAA